MQRYERAFYSPMVSNWDNYDTWMERGQITAPQWATWSNRGAEMLVHGYVRARGDGKIVVEPNGAAPLLYLPMDKLGQGGAPAAEVLSGQGQVIPPAATGGSREAARTTRNLEEAR